MQQQNIAGWYLLDRIQHGFKIDAIGSLVKVWIGLDSTPAASKTAGWLGQVGSLSQMLAWQVLGDEITGHTERAGTAWCLYGDGTAAHDLVVRPQNHTCCGGIVAGVAVNGQVALGRL
jgi:hypothetical protein